MANVVLGLPRNQDRARLASVPISEPRYTKSGDLHIAYRVEGGGPFDIVLVPPHVVSIDSPGSVLPGYRRWDFSSLIAAYLFELAQFGIIALMIGRGAATVPVLALFGLVRLVISGAVGLTIVYAILSWVNADSPMTDVIDRLASPLLRPFRRVIPLVGGFDLSPLALLVVLQVLAIIVANLQDALLR